MDREHRLVVMGEYRLNDQLWLQAAFGKNHESAPGRSLIAQLGLSFAVAEDRYNFGPKAGPP